MKEMDRFSSFQMQFLNQTKTIQSADSCISIYAAASKTDNPAQALVTDFKPIRRINQAVEIDEVIETIRV
ncbi:hypothetical protein [Burkholderia alba]|uniref:hypothetical protein n=1 Tax=Burkholderia alba TaxID=2683677 RepID=UPI002B0558BC|nr:hypothetical protein [Burkholderia alba]